jgi:NADP-dependent 3-hydroxy acid dehydrogenase YdfG
MMAPLNSWVLITGASSGFGEQFAMVQLDIASLIGVTRFLRET